MKKFVYAGAIIIMLSAVLFRSNGAQAQLNGRQIYWGAWIDGNPYERSDAPWDSTTWDTFEQHAGKKVSIVHWGMTYPTSFAYHQSAALKVKNRGAINLIDLNTSNVKLADIAAGKYDSYFTTWATEAKTFGIPFFLRLDWEMNGKWFNWGTAAGNPLGNTPADYVSMWKRVYDIFKQQGANNVTFVWCPNVNFTGSVPLNQLYPGDAYVHWTCLDGYNKGALYGTNDWKTFYNLFRASYENLLQIAPSKPIMIAETASTEKGDASNSKASWITDALTVQLTQNFPEIRAFVWFNWDTTENGVHTDWPIESSAGAQTAFAAGISSPYYATNTFSTLPSGPVQPISVTTTVVPSSAPTVTPTRTPTRVPTSVPTAVPSATPTTVNTCSLKSMGDANCDRLVDVVDFEVWRREYNAETLTKNADFNGDNGVNLLDFEIMRQHFTF